MRDSGLDVSYTLRDAAIAEKRQSFLNASENGFAVGNYQEMIPTADLLINLTPDKQHTAVVTAVMPLLKTRSDIVLLTRIQYCGGRNASKKRYYCNHGSAKITWF